MIRFLVSTRESIGPQLSMLCVRKLLPIRVRISATGTPADWTEAISSPLEGRANLALETANEVGGLTHVAVTEVVTVHSSSGTRREDG